MSNLCTKICEFENVTLYDKGPIIDPQQYQVGLKMKLLKLRKVTIYYLVCTETTLEFGVKTIQHKYVIHYFSIYCKLDFNLQI